MAAPRRRSRGHIETRPNGRFRAKVYVGEDSLTGKQRYLTKTTGTYKEAEVELTTLLGQVDGNRHPRNAVTVSQVVAQWLEVAELADKTRQRYEGLVRLYIEPALGSHPAAKLDPELLERLYSRMRRCNRLCARKALDHACRPLSASAVRQTHFILRAASIALSAGTTSASTSPRWPNRPRSSAATPTRRRRRKSRRSSMTLAGTGLGPVPVADDGHRLPARRDVRAALERRRPDPPCRKRLPQFSETADATREKATKSNQKRRLALAEHTASLLRDYRAQSEAIYVEFGVTLPSSAFVFSNSLDGSAALLPSTVSQRYRRLAVRAGPRSTRLHALRHYSATELLTAGVDLRTVAGRLGHGSGGGTTLRFYAAWVEAADGGAADAIASLLPTPDPTLRAAQHPYEVIAAVLREQIRVGTLASGSQLPTSIELAEQHDVSAGTVNRAVALLKEAGLIEATRGRRAHVKVIRK